MNRIFDWDYNELPVFLLLLPKQQVAMWIGSSPEAFLPQLVPLRVQH
jgi:hypothetical protein